MAPYNVAADRNYSTPLLPTVRRIVLIDGGRWIAMQAWQLWKDGRALELIDPTLLAGDAAAGAMARCVKVALLCVQDSAADRPTMADVTAMLAAASVDDEHAPQLPDPRRPPHFRLRVSTSDDDGWSEASRTRSSRGTATTSFSTNDLTITTIEEGR
jgi:hypothetical protein